MIDLVFDACRAAGIGDVTVVANPGQPEVMAHLDGRCRVVLQHEQRGTGHALAQVPFEGGGAVLVLNADSPLIRAETIRKLVRAHAESGCVATLASVEDPGRADGRIVRFPDGTLERIVEDKDADAEVRRIQEFNVGLYCFDAEAVTAALGRLSPDNAAGELYLTDVFKDLRPVQVIRLEDAREAMGINDRVQLSRAEAAMRDRILQELMLSGVTVVDPASSFVEVGVKVGQDTILEPFTILRGATSIGAGCQIGPYAQITDSTIEDRCRVERSWLNGCRVGEGSDCGPFSKLRPGAEIAADVHVGSFAEIVRSRIGSGSAVPHFSYVGDAVVGERVNIGAGTVFVNYDGTAKHSTEVGDDAFIGSGTMLRAPVKVGGGARTGAGAVVTKDVESGETVVGVPARPMRRSPLRKAETR